MKKLAKLFIFVATFFIVAQAFADGSPAVMLNNVAKTAIADLKKQKAKTPKGQKISVAAIDEIINRVFLPYVDLDTMSRAVLGRNIWRSASTSQRAAFKAQFTELVISTYASALASFNNNKVQFYRIRGGYQGKSIVQVNSTISAPGTKPLPVVYHLLKQKNGKWSIYDFSVDGISLVETYKAQFSSIVQSKGLSGLISQMKDHNASQ